MKKTIFLIAAVLCLSAISCENINVTPAEEEEIQFNFTVGAPGVNTKAAKTGWEAGDKLNIWFDGNGSDQTIPDLILTFDGTQWNAGALRSGVQAGLKASGQITAVYEGHNDLSLYKKYWDSGNEIEWFSSPTYFGNAGVFRIPMVASVQEVSYSYDTSTKTLTSTLTGWIFKTPFKVLVKNVSPSSPADYYQLQIHNITKNTYAETMSEWGIKHFTNWTAVVQRTGEAYGRAGAIRETDGEFAFYYDYSDYSDYSSFIIESTDEVEFLFTTYGYGGDTRRYSITGKTLSSLSNSKCTGIALSYSLFSVVP